ncbi:hypothetical protein ABD87_14635 [Lysinibacillus sphaericus]|uniref:hypothetical protein n=1 Tax=Lysinibacillus sphaericus TaxID=1421 RepID=UPI0018CDD0BD|nr:hypothetical protein [Lysinibacillus sphaericus]MBG9730737.1 hypothetical protein [Lysinibacillus sphaericus]
MKQRNVSIKTSLSSNEVAKACNRYYYGKKCSVQRIKNRIIVIHSMLKGYYTISQAVERIVRLDKILYSDETTIKPYKNTVHRDISHILSVLGLPKISSGKVSW